MKTPHEARCRAWDVARKVKRKDAETGTEIEEVEYADVQGTLDPGEVLRAIEGAIRVQGQHPDQQVQGTGVQVSIDINTEWDGSKNPEVVNPGDHTESPESEGEPPPVVGVTTSLAVVRFHGRNAATWEAKGLSAAERFRYRYSEAELEAWVPTVRRLADEADGVYVLFNNCYRDYAARSALEMADLLAGGA